MEKIFGKARNILEKVIKFKPLWYLIVMALLLLTYYSDFKSKVENLEGNYIKYFLIASAVSGAMTFILIMLSKKLYKKVKPHIVYIIFALIIGGMYVLAIPLCAQSDEPAHMYRAFQVAKGEIISPITENGFETDLPKSLINMINVNSQDKSREYKKYYDIKEMSKIELNEEDTVKVTTVGNYHGISYLPQVVGIKIGLVLNLNTYYCAMLGRITGLIILVLLLGLGIKKLPKYKLFATIILLSPVALSYIACISADGVVLASVFLLISYVLHYIHTKSKIKKLDYLILAILVFTVSISKMAYLPVIGILLFIPKECFNKPKRKWVFVTIFILIGLASYYWWMSTGNISTGSGNPSNTNTWIYKDPIGYLVVLFRTTVTNAYSYIEDMFAGHFLCHNQVNPYAIVPLAYIIIAVVAFLGDENDGKTTFWRRLITVGIIAFSYLLISTAMYVFNTSFKGSVIIGVQGRYLLPLLLLIVFIGGKKRLDIKEADLVNIALIANYAVYLTMFAKFFV